MFRCKGNGAKVITKTVGICIILNICLTALPKYILLPVIHIVDLALVGSNNSVNRGCNYIVVIPHPTYLLESNLWKTLMKSVYYSPKWLYEIWFLSSLLFSLWSPIFAGRFAVDAAFLFASALLMFMCRFLLTLKDSFWSCCALIKPMIVAETTDWFSVMSPTALFSCCCCVSLWSSYWWCISCHFSVESHALPNRAVLPIDHWWIIYLDC